MKINTKKNKMPSNRPIRCTLEIKGRIIKHVIKCLYRSVLVTSNGDIIEEVRMETNKIVAVSGWLKDAMWKNKDLSIKIKPRIYKTCTRPIMAYSVEIRPDRRKRKQLLKGTEM